MSEREHDDGRCCENGFFGQQHECMKRTEAPTVAIECAKPRYSAILPNGLTPEPPPAEAREWWIDLEGMTAYEKIEHVGPFDVVRVIEFAAYERIERELAEAKQESADAWSSEEATGRLLTKERSRSAGLVDALGMLEHVGLIEPYDRIVREAIAKYEETK